MSLLLSSKFNIAKLIKTTTANKIAKNLIVLVIDLIDVIYELIRFALSSLDTKLLTPSSANKSFLISSLSLIAFPLESVFKLTHAFKLVFDNSGKVS